MYTILADRIGHLFQRIGTNHKTDRSIYTMGVGKVRDNLTRKEIVGTTAKNLNLVFEDVLLVFNEALEVLSAEMVKGRNVELRDFGVFKIVETKPRKMKIINSEERRVIPARKKISFHPSKKLKASLTQSTESNNDNN